MADNVPVSRADGPGKHAAGQGADAVSGPAAQQVDPAALGAAFPRTHHVLWLEFGDRADWDDTRREWRRLFSELLGTFALVLAAAGGGLLHVVSNCQPSGTRTRHLNAGRLVRAAAACRSTSTSCPSPRSSWHRRSGGRRIIFRP